VAKKFFNGVDNNNQLLVNVASPSATTDAANKGYVDGVANGLSWKNAVRAATTTNVATLAGGAPNTIDGVTLAANDRVLVKNQTTQSGNGIYTVTTLGTGANGTWTRATDMDAAAEFPNATTYVSEGTTQADTQWTVTTNAPVVVGTTAITWVQVGTGGTTYSAGNGLSLATTTFSVLADPVAGSGISVTASGVKVDTAVVVRKFAANIGDGSTTAIAVTHNLGTKDITWSLQDVSTGAFYDTDAVATSTTVLTLTFPTAPATNSLRVVVHA
jgi:hypothetical protein